MSLAPPLPAERACCLFLDIDGTLLEFAETPDAVRIDEALRDLLRNLDRACDGAVALVSGRTIEDIDDLFDPLFLAVAGVHGCERRDARGHWYRPTYHDPTLAVFRERLRAAVQPLSEILIEDKEGALAAHFRKAPQLETPLRATIERLLPTLPSSHEMMEGDCVLEFKPKAHNKATAIEAFMQEDPFAGRLPIFIGDDTTDEDGFAAVRRFHGIPIAVGNRASAEWRLDSPPAVRRWLESFLARKSAA